MRKERRGLSVTGQLPARAEVRDEACEGVTEPRNTSSGLPPLSQEALEWVIRLKLGAPTVADAEAFRVWRDQSPEHAAAAREAALLWKTAAIAAHEFSQERQHESRTSGGWSVGQRLPSRRMVLGASLAASVVGYAVVRPPFALWPSLSDLSSDFRTAKGERRKVDLAADISLEMNTHTSIALRSTKNEPRIELISGEAAISSRRPASAPFVVIAAGGQIFAATACFNMCCLDGMVSATCIEGEVDVKAGERSVRLQAGFQVAYSDNRLGAPIAAEIEQAMAWQAGLLVFNDRPLADVIREVNRYRPGRIILINSALGERLVNGRFRLDRLDDVIIQIRQLFRPSIQHLPGGIVLLS
ncbi:MAG: FecR domain-containing protein [Hyphomicrobium sp.]